MYNKFNVRAKATVDIDFTAIIDADATPEEIFAQIQKQCTNKAKFLEEMVGENSVSSYGIEDILEVKHEGTGKIGDPSVYEQRNDILKLWW